MTRHAAIILVDARGRLLLQERDEHAPTDPLRWGLVGGAVEDGEDFETAAYRELAEETGLRWSAGLELWRDARFPGRATSPDQGAHFQVWTAATALTDADITVGEGRRIVFVDPEILPLLDLVESAAVLVRDFLVSGTYLAMPRSA